MMLIQTFAKNRIVGDLSSKHIEQLFSAGTVAHVGRDEIIVKETQYLRSVFMLLTGEVLVFLPETNERLVQVDLTTLTMGDCFGEYSFIDHQPTSASVKAISDCDLYSISHDDFRAFFDSNKDAGFIIYRNLLTMLVERLRGNNAELDLFNFS